MKTIEQQLQRDLVDDKYPGPTDWKISTEEKKWTDEDMLRIAGATVAICNNMLSDKINNEIKDWLDQYKAKKQ